MSERRWMVVLGQGCLTTLGAALWVIRDLSDLLAPASFLAATLLQILSPASAHGSVRLYASIILMNALGVFATQPVPALPGACLLALFALTTAFNARRIELDVRGFQEKLTDQAPLVTLGRFAQGLAHEFHNVLGGVQGLLDFASRSQDPAEIREALEVSSRSLQRAAVIVENLKMFTREAPLERRPCDLSQVVTDSLAMIAHECRKAKIDVVTDLTPATVTADPARLQQVFLNLEMNAVRAMQPGGRLTVRIDGTRVSFADTGCGIEDLSDLFKPRFSTRRTCPAPTGLGLGLFVSDRIMRQHGGTIEVQSEPDRGSTFTVVLP